jgi:hypothetical protein
MIKEPMVLRVRFIQTVVSFHDPFPLDGENLNFDAFHLSGFFQHSQQSIALLRVSFAYKNFHLTWHGVLCKNSKYFVIHTSETSLCLSYNVLFRSTILL